MPTTLPLWQTHSANLHRACVTIFEHPVIVDETRGFEDPKALCKGLIARTLGNFEGVQLMVREKMIAEARTLTRCCYENLFWTTALVEKGDEIVMKMRNEYVQQTRRESERILSWAEKQETRFDFEEILKSGVEYLRKNWKSAGRTTQASMAADGEADEAYLIYMQLSSDSAHPSSLSLSRHIQRDKAERTIIFRRSLMDPSELSETLGMACAAVFGICMAANELVGNPLSETEIGKLRDEYAAIPHGPEV